MSVGLVLVGGHESDGGRDLHRLRGSLPGCTVTGVGRALESAVRTSLERHDAVVVVPMTFGRDPALVTEAATTLRWLASGEPRRAALGAPPRPGSLGRPATPPQVALAAPFGTPDHLVSRLRAAAAEVARRDPHAALIVHARSSDPFDDAELHRIAHLVRAHGAGLEVAVATTSCTADLAPVVARLRVLGFPRTVVVPAGFTAGPGGVDLDAPAHAGVGSSGPLLTDAAFAGVVDHGPLLTDAAIARVVRDRADTALHALDHGDDGIERAPAAAHDHGFAHTHAHDHASGPADAHLHSPADAHSHAGVPAPGHPGATEHDHPHPPRYPTWRAASPATTTDATTSRSTPAAPR